jgi:hypothetical protein
LGAALGRAQLSPYVFETGWSHQGQVAVLGQPRRQRLKSESVDDPGAYVL